MLRSKRHLAWFAAAAFGALGVHVGGCSSEGNGASATNGDAGQAVEPEGGASDAARPAPAFLDPSAYADLVTIDPSLPFGVTQKHAADEAIVGSRWGRHGGPMVTTGVYGASGAETPKVVQWGVAGDPTAAAVRTERAFAVASGLPATAFYGADGMVDLPFGSLSLLSYTGSGDPYPGEALLYTAAYDQVASRAKVNGFYSGAGVETGDRQLVVYSGLSPMAKAGSSTNDNGLYVAPLCNGALASDPPCAAPWKLFGWNGPSGPVATDVLGDVFVGASLASGATSDAVYGLTKAQIASGSPASAATIAEIDSKGTASLAAIAPEGNAPGWALGIGYDATSAVYAASFIARDGVLSRGSVVVKTAIARASGVSGLSVFTDSEGDLWLAVTKGSRGTYLELRRRTP